MNSLSPFYVLTDDNAEQPSFVAHITLDDLPESITSRPPNSDKRSSLTKSLSFDARIFLTAPSETSTSRQPPPPEPNDARNSDSKPSSHSETDRTQDHDFESNSSWIRITDCTTGKTRYLDPSRPGSIDGSRSLSNILIETSSGDNIRINNLSRKSDERRSSSTAATARLHFGSSGTSSSDEGITADINNERYVETRIPVRRLRRYMHNPSVQALLRKGNDRAAIVRALLRRIRQRVPVIPNLLSALNDSPPEIDKDKPLCKICNNANVDTYFSKCGHSSLCITCCTTTNVCPICRRKIKPQSVFRMFFE